MLYNVVLVSAVQQSESAIRIHIPPGRVSIVENVRELTRGTIVRVLVEQDIKLEVLTKASRYNRY